MRTGPGAEFEGLFHETALFGSDAEFRATARPFLEEGLDAHDPTYVVLNPGTEELVREDFGELDGIRYVSPRDAYVNPAATIQGYRDASIADVAAGAEQVRFITEVPHPGVGAAWDWWGRYESAANALFTDLPVWAMCTYDRRTTPSDVLEEVLRAHPYLAGPDGEHTFNDLYETPADFLDRRTCSYADPLEDEPPMVELVEPSLGEARRAAAAVVETRLGSEAMDDLALAVSEVVANAYRHGRSPVSLRLWAGPDRILASVRDSGPGTRDATVGLAQVPADDAGGRGLWIVNQLCDHVSITKPDDGFVVKLVLGTPAFAS